MKKININNKSYLKCIIIIYTIKYRKYFVTDKCSVQLTTHRMIVNMNSGILQIWLTEKYKLLIIKLRNELKALYLLAISLEICTNIKVTEKSQNYYEAESKLRNKEHTQPTR